MELFYMPRCPFCVRVLDFLEGKTHDIVMKDTIAHPEYREELGTINGGNTQVPCLIVDGKPMLESLDIIAFLEKKICET